MKWNAWLLPLVMAGSLASVYFLPQAGSTAQSAVRMELPGSAGGWWFEKQVPSKDEVLTLGPETDFAKARCLKPRPGEISLDGRYVPDLLDLSIVLSGSDLNTSIHRPERCMPAQGHTITGSQAVRIKLDNGREFEAKRLLSVKRIQGERKGTTAAEFKCVTYYFFVGHDRITNDHLERTLIDMKDRLVRGMDQRWAYVSASMMFGRMPWIENEVTEAEADEKLRKFITDFAGRQIDWSQVKP